ncbi:MAG TPA: hypothetical protein VGS28_03185 [Candidatus Saccharimonadales bacterium]|nr:hypothetical protein [Candidatus Saccharimonadales bacterium]
MQDDGLRQRIGEAQRLSREHGGAEHIPAAALAAIAYARVQGPDGEFRLLPQERLGGLSAEQYEQELHAGHEALTRPPFEVIGGQVATEGGYAARVNADVLIGRVAETVEVICDETADFGWLPDDDPLVRGLIPRIDNPNLYVKQGDRYMKVALSLTARGIKDHIHDLDLGSRKKVDFLPAVFDIDINEIEKYTPAQAAQIWTELERLKSQLTDVEVLEQACDEAFSETYIDEAETSEPYWATTYELPEEADVNNLTREQRFAIALVPYRDLLTRQGFADVAAQLEGMTTGAEIRSVLVAAQGSNVLRGEYKVREKELKRRRQALTDQDDIFQNHREMTALQAELKERLSLLRLMNRYFNAPSEYAQLTTRRINELQKMLVADAGQYEFATIQLDARPDPEKDRNPGAISGDCTEGKPLPFAEPIGLHNVKVNLDGEYRGNIYLLRTQTEAGGSAWHLDAIQIPSHLIQWSSFPENLVNLLAAEARKSGVRYITINAYPLHMSNYTYISSAFLEYLGLPESLDSAGVYDVEEIQRSRTKEVKVKFPDVDTGKYTNFQGANSSQLVLYENEEEPGALRAA